MRIQQDRNYSLLYFVYAITSVSNIQFPLIPKFQCPQNDVFHYFSQIFIRYIVLQYGRLIHFNSPLNHYTFPCKTKIHLETLMNNAPTDKKNWKRINFTRKSLVQVSTNIARATSSSVYRLLTREERRPSKFDRPRKQHDGQPITR